jgi:uncharacterized LabA/DUF88 family protein
VNEERLKIAVFVDFDNIEIGVKSTLGRAFDIGTVLEAIKERGEVVTKIAYGNWKQAESYSRHMTDHAVQMVQRNTTPGGDKNGADINLALDALEMAFTRDHINAFVIVGGDSDFIALVEKLKQYDKKVFIVGGRAFTSAILQKNCHEFIAYENLIGLQTGTRKTAGREPAAGRPRMDRAMPLVRRALKVLADREVSPQLGLLKSTLLQLDSTFSERDYGAGTFREFIQKLANAGMLTLKQVDRSLLVELKDGDGSPAPAAAPAPVLPEAAPPARETPPPPSRETAPPPAEAAEALRVVRTAFQSTRKEVRWPMYLRNVKQFLKSSAPGFDERRFGFSGLHELVREAQRAGLLRVERDRQGILRIYPGDRLAEAPAEESIALPPPDEQVPPVAEVTPPAEVPSGPVAEAAPEVPAIAEPEPALEAVPEPAPPAPEPRRRRASTPKAKVTRKTPAKRTRKAVSSS